MPVIRMGALLGVASIMTAASPAPLTGSWGARGAMLTLDAAGGRLEQDCASASFGGVRSDGQGGFRAKGRFDAHQPGPQRADVPAGVPARFEGKVEGKTLTLTIRPERGEVQTLILTAGLRPKLIRCM